MADKRIHELDELTNPQSTDWFLMEQSSSNVDKKVKMQNLVPYDTMVSIITSILEAHPEWTTTVEDGSIDIDKLATDTLALINSKAETDGYYEDMAVGSAEQLLSNIFETDKSPYLYRTSGGSLEIGDRVYEDAIVGGSIAWNQLAKALASGNYGANHCSVSYSNEKAICMADSTDSFGIYQPSAWRPSLKNHKYLICADVTSVASGKVQVGFSNTAILDISANVKTRIATITSCQADATVVYCYKTTNITVGDTMNIENLVMHDLTLALGSTIADYAYTLETSEAGSGIAWLKSQGFFTKDYYAYNAGGIESVKTSAKKVIGFNQWDEQWEVGTYNETTGEKQSYVSTIRSKNMIKVLPNTTYYTRVTTGDLRILKYGANKEYLGVISTPTSHLLTIDANTYYINFRTVSAYGTTYNNDICINFHWDGERDGEYEPYEEHTYPLGNDELRGLYKLSNGKIYANGDVKTSDGQITRNYAIVDLGSLTYDRTVSGLFKTVISGQKGGESSILPGSILCPLYVAIDSTSITGPEGSNPSPNMVMAVTGAATTPVMYFNNTSYTDPSAFKTAMSGVYLLYKLETPTTESADPYTNPQLISNWGTEEFVDTRDVPVPVGHDSRYLPDLKAKLESAPNNPSTNGKYFLQYQNGEATYVPVPSEVPQTPSEDGTYVLKATVSSGTATLAWVAEE